MRQLERLSREQVQARYDMRDYHRAVLDAGDEWRPRYVGTLYRNEDGTIKGHAIDCEGRKYKVWFEWDGIIASPAKLRFMDGDLVEDFFPQTSGSVFNPQVKTFKGAIRWPANPTEPVSLRRRTRLDRRGKVTEFEMYTTKLF